LVFKNYDKTWSHAGIELVSVELKIITPRASLAVYPLRRVYATRRFAGVVLKPIRTPHVETDR